MDGPYRHGRFPLGSPGNELWNSLSSGDALGEDVEEDEGQMAEDMSLMFLTALRYPLRGRLGTALYPAKLGRLAS